jgi:hypothetical protein
VVAWFDDGDLTSMGDLKARTFDASLSPTSPDQVLAHTAGLSTSAVLAPFAGSWAAAWLSYQEGSVSVLARGGGAQWTAGSLGAGAIVDRPALVDLDGTHLLLVYAASPGVNEPAQLQGAVLDASAPGDVAPFAIPPAGGAMGAEAREPSLARVGGRVFLSWLSNTGPSDAQALPGYVWIKEMDLGSMPGSIDTSRAEIPLPRWPADSTGSQGSPVLALSLPGAPEMLVAAWQDALVPGPSSGLFAEAIPVPILRKAGP